MTTHRTGTRKEWLANDSSCLRRRRSSPGAMMNWRSAAGVALVRVHEEYRFDTTTGASLSDFSGAFAAPRLPFMFGPTTPGCPSCSMIADGFDGLRAPGQP